MDNIREIRCAVCDLRLPDRTAGLPGRDRKYCSPRCRNDHKRSTRHVVRVAARQTNSEPLGTCPQCTAEIPLRPLGKSGPAPTYCSIKCQRSARSKQLKKEPVPVACERCGTLTYPTTNRGRRFCTPSCAQASRRDAGRFQKTCEFCSLSFMAYESSRRFCSLSCVTCHKNSVRYAHLAGELKGKGHITRARRYGVAYETINSKKVFQRDGWSCGICNRPVDQSLKWPHPLSASLDHVVPLSRGGVHLQTNVQCAHLRCNIVKGANV